MQGYFVYKVLTMKRIIVAILVSLGLAFALPVPAANAGECSLNGTLCGQIKHYSPDDGYDAAIIIRCDWSDDTSLAGARYLAEGQNSTSYCKDTDQVYVRTDEEIWCKKITSISAGLYVWVKTFDSHGWHKIDNTFGDGLGCTVRRD